MYRWGRWTNELPKRRIIEDLLREARGNTAALCRVELDQLTGIVRRLADLGSVDVPVGDPPASNPAVRGLAAISPGTQRSLAAVMSPQRWMRLAGAEFGDAAVLDWQRRPGVMPRRVVPVGVVLHLMADVSPQEIVDALLACFFTRNVALLLIGVPESLEFAAWFLRRLDRADVDRRLTSAVAVYPSPAKAALGRALACAMPDAVIRWRGYATAPKTISAKRSIEPCSPAGVAVISRAYWSRQGCPSSLDALFRREEGPSPGFALPRGWLCLVEYGIELDSSTARSDSFGSGRLAASRVLRYASVAELVSTLEPIRPCPGICVYGLETGERLPYFQALANVGIHRFQPLDVAPGVHEGVNPPGYSLRALVHWISDERHFGVADLLREAASQVPFYAERAPDEIARLTAWPLLTAQDLAREPLHRGLKLLNTAIRHGSIFASGGTSTAPKYAVYTANEFSRCAELLARGFMAAGLQPGDRVINLFVAGHLWSSFLVVDEALRRCGVYILPMGGLSNVDEIIECLLAFKPRVAFGLPSMLVDYARHTVKSGADITVERVFYAGEHINSAARGYLETVWKTTAFHSAGYAAVDVGPIGWQCAQCGVGEHHLFIDAMQMEIINDEAVVTSLLRRAMPVIRYRTGDRVEWLPGHCACGSSEPRFRLLGRVDDIMNVWGCRLAFQDVERSLTEAGLAASTKQLTLRQGASPDDAEHEVLTVRIELPDGYASPDAFERFLVNLHHFSKDAGLALDVSSLRRRIRLEVVPPDTIPRLPRTGKVRLIVDERDHG